MATHLDILNAVKGTVQGLAVTGTVVVRKQPFWVSEHDSFPLICLSPEAEQIESLTFENIAFIDYPVVVMHVIRRGSSPESQAEILEQLEFREKVRLALWRPSLAGVDAVMDCNYEPEPPFDMSGLDQTFDVSLQLFTFRTSEARSSS